MIKIKVKELGFKTIVVVVKSCFLHLTLCTSPSCDGSDVILGGSLRTRNSVVDVTESREVLAVHEYSPLVMMMVMRRRTLMPLIMLLSS